MMHGPINIRKKDEIQFIRSIKAHYTLHRLTEHALPGPDPFGSHKNETDVYMHTPYRS